MGGWQYEHSFTLFTLSIILVTLFTPQIGLKYDKNSLIHSQSIPKRMSNTIKLKYCEGAASSSNNHNIVYCQAHIAEMNRH